MTVFERAGALGLVRVAHPGEEDPAAYISGALDTLDVCRIHHSVSCLENEDLVERLQQTQVPLTVCPLSNVYLKVIERPDDHQLPTPIDQGLNITLSSDDPAYFGGGMQNNFVAYHDMFAGIGTCFYH